MRLKGVRQEAVVTFFSFSDSTTTLNSSDSLCGLLVSTGYRLLIAFTVSFNYLVGSRVVIAIHPNMFYDYC